MANEIIKKYFDAWHQHDSDTILTTYAEGGSYSDPATGGKLTGAAIAEYADALFTAFPDMSVELISSAEASNGMIAAPWIILGTHNGPLMDKPATGKKIVLLGCDFMKVEGSLLALVEGVWDINGLYAQLGWSDT
ncbi:MAG: ester cyclase [Chromatiales bacterium]|nr:ester cyclase [Chromatiales bacterium]